MGWCSEEARLYFGERLKTAIGSFTVDFLPHMREEEEVCVCGGWGVLLLCINGCVLLCNRNRTVEIHRPGGKEKIREGKAAFVCSLHSAQSQCLILTPNRSWLFSFLPGQCDTVD